MKVNVLCTGGILGGALYGYILYSHLGEKANCMHYITS